MLWIADLVGVEPIEVAQGFGHGEVELGRDDIADFEPVTPYQPITGIWSSVTRMTELVGVQGPKWRISAKQALQMYTMGSAWCGFHEDVLGSLQPGKYADMVVLSEDPRTVEPAMIKEIVVMTTIMDGKIVFEREARQAGGSPDVVRVTGPIEEGCACTSAAGDHET